VKASPRSFYFDLRGRASAKLEVPSAGVPPAFLEISALHLHQFGRFARSSIRILLKRRSRAVSLRICRCCDVASDRVPALDRHGFVKKSAKIRAWIDRSTHPMRRLSFSVDNFTPFGCTRACVSGGPRGARRRWHLGR